MIDKIIERKIQQAEANLGVPLEYLRDMARTSPAALTKFWMVQPLTQHREVAPIELLSVARLVASLHQDCGECVQIEVNLARKLGVDRDVVNAVLNHEPDRLDERLNRVWRFAQAVVSRDPMLSEVHAELTENEPPKVALEIALAITTGTFYPLLKRGMGHAVSCSLVTVEA